MKCNKVIAHGAILNVKPAKDRTHHSFSQQIQNGRQEDVVGTECRATAVPKVLGGRGGKTNHLSDRNGSMATVDVGRTEYVGRGACRGRRASCWRGGRLMGINGRQEVEEKRNQAQSGNGKPKNDNMYENSVGNYMSRPMAARVRPAVVGTDLPKCRGDQPVSQVHQRRKGRGLLKYFNFSPCCGGNTNGHSDDLAKLRNSQAESFLCKSSWPSTAVCELNIKVPPGSCDAACKSHDQITEWDNVPPNSFDIPSKLYYKWERDRKHPESVGDNCRNQNKEWEWDTVFPDHHDPGVSYDDAVNKSCDQNIEWEWDTVTPDENVPDLSHDAINKSYNLNVEWEWDTVPPESSDTSYMPIPESPDQSTYTDSSKDSDLLHGKEKEAGCRLHVATALALRARSGDEKKGGVTSESCDLSFGLAGELVIGAFQKDFKKEKECSAEKSLKRQSYSDDSLDDDFDWDWSLLPQRPSHVPPTGPTHSSALSPSPSDPKDSSKLPSSSFTTSPSLSLQKADHRRSVSGSSVPDEEFWGDGVSSAASRRQVLPRQCKGDMEGSVGGSMENLIPVTISKVRTGTIKPLNKGHIGANYFVPYREIVLI